MNNRLVRLTLHASLLALGAATTQAQVLAPQNATGASHPAPAVKRQPPAPAGSQRAGLNILVFDDNTIHQFAQQAAMNIDAAGTVIATATDFDTLLASQTWDVVAVDCPSTKASSGWGALTSYVSGGGKVVMSYWDWDVDPALTTAFECQNAGTFSLSGNTLVDLGTTQIFSGVTMPNSDWDNHWGDDGDSFTPQGTAIGIGHVGVASKPSMVLGNNGATIASQVIDEAGPIWQADGSAVLLWENMLNEVLGGTLSTDVDQISLSTGGQQVLTMNLTPTAALKTYQVLGSATGAVPGFAYTGTAIPLNPDAYTIFTLLNPNTPPLLNSAGILDSNGKATIVFTLGAGSDPSLAGLLINHAGITLEVISGFVVVTEATDPATCLLVP